MTVILIEAETREWESRPPDFDDPWDHGDTDGCLDNVTAELADGPAYDRRGCLGSLRVDLEGVKAGDFVYAVTAVWGSYDTFGRTGVTACVLDVFKTEGEAAALLKAAENHKGSGSLSFNGHDYYIGWSGWGSSLQSIDGWTLEVRGDSPGRVSGRWSNR